MWYNDLVLKFLYQQISTCLKRAKNPWLKAETSKPVTQFTNKLIYQPATY